MISKIVSIIIIIIFILIVFCFVKNKEDYNVGVGAGRVFGVHYNPSPLCSAENDCFPGTYYRSQIYQNMCEPLDYKEGGLLRDKIQPIDGCVRSLASDLPPLEENIICEVDKNNQRHCYIKK